MQQNAARANIFVLGSFVAACSAKVSAPPRAGESVAAETFLLEAGGKGFNLAAACRRLDAAVDGLFAIGDDALSALAEPALIRADLPAGMLRRRPGPTGAGVGFIAANGETWVAVHAGANMTLGAADARASGTAIAVADMTVAQFETSDAVIAEAFALARTEGRRTLLTPSPFRPIPSAILGATSILCVNRVEAAALATQLGLPDADDVGALGAALFPHGPEALVVTLGAEGALAALPDGALLIQPAFAVTAVDTLGAGDAFAAGLAVALCEGYGWTQALRRAAACGALVASRFGVFDALPTRDAVDAMAQDGSRT